MKKDNYNSLLKAIGDRKPLIMDLGDNVLLHMKWNVEENIYEDEMGKTALNVIQDVLNEKVYIQGKLVKLYIEEN